MTNRIIDISAEALSLSSRNGLLVLRSQGEELDSIPFGEIAAVVASHRQITVTQAALSDMAAGGAVFISCDAKMMPASMLLPINAHFSQTDRFTRQAALSLPRRKRFWRAVVRRKIESQAAALRRLRGFDAGLAAMARRVRSGDAGNVESQAARRYWPLVFADPAFRRGDDRDPRNALLNYGYAVLRAVTARAVCAAGLHPSFGLHHANRLNPFVLADDLMEPWRPAVDSAVAGLGPTSLETRSKRAIIGAVTGRYEADGASRTLFDILARTAQSLANAIGPENVDWSPPPWSFLDPPTEARR